MGTAEVMAAGGSGAGHYRWFICALIFLATTINYVDRQVIGILKPTLQDEFGWSEIDYANIVTAFQAAYAIGLLASGWLMDRLGTKVGYALALVVWSLAAMSHSLAQSVAGFATARFVLGLGEAGNFPAAIKSVAEWFPKKERALATGLFNSGTNVGALMTPLIVPWITVTYGWEWAFILTGAFGFLWLLLWIPFYGQPETHPRVSESERAYIRSDPPEPSAVIPWVRLFPYREAWAFAAGKFMTDPIWWLYLFWIPDFLNRNYGLNLVQMGPPLVVIYLVADVGSIGGGWLSSSLIKRGWSLNAARKSAMLACALLVVPIVFASRAGNLWLAVALVSIAAAAHQGWSANLFTFTSDMFPRRAVGSVVGFGGMAGAVGGVLISKLTGYILEFSGSYVPVFLLAGFAYLTALGVIHLLVPEIRPVRVEADAAGRVGG